MTRISHELHGCLNDDAIYTRLTCITTSDALETVRTTRPEKCDIFSQRYQSQPIIKNSKNTANIFLTVRNYVKIFLSQNIMHNF